MGSLFFPEGGCTVRKCINIQSKVYMHAFLILNTRNLSWCNWCNWCNYYRLIRARYS
jgi:hypothetical protein